MVQGGYYSTGASTSTRTAEVECEVGHWCASGLKTPCAAGRYGSTAGLTSSVCTGACPAGYVCPEASFASAPSGVAGNDVSACGSASVFCPEGSTSSTLVATGWYSTGGSDATTRTGEATCGAGSYCTAGVSVACPAGRWALTPGQSSSACEGACAAGRWGGTQQTTDQCVRGIAPGVGMLRIGCATTPCLPLPMSTAAPACVCGAHAATVACAPSPLSPLLPMPVPLMCVRVRVRCVLHPQSGACTRGYVCAAGSGSATASPCGDASVYCPASSGSATSVQGGYYSTGASTSTRTAEVECEVGHWCASGVKTPCAAGRYGSTAGLTSSVCTGACPAGYVCPEASFASAPSGVAGNDVSACGSASVFCPLGSTSSTLVATGWYSTGGSDATTRTGEATCGAG